MTCIIGLEKIKNILIILVIAGFAIGFRNAYEANNFFLNLLAGIVVSSLSILIAICFIDKAADAIKEEQWSRVRKLTYGSIINDLAIIAFSIYIKLPIADLSYVDSYDPNEIAKQNETILRDLPTEFKRFLNMIPQVIVGQETTTDDGLAVEECDVCRIIKTTYEDIRPVLDGIKYNRIPRLIQSSTDQNIIDAMVKFEGLIDAYYYNMQRFIREDESVSRGHFTIRSLDKLVDDTLSLYALIKAEIEPASIESRAQERFSSSSYNDNMYDKIVDSLKNVGDQGYPLIAIILIIISIVIMAISTAPHAV